MKTFIILLVAYPASIAAVIATGHGCLLARQNYRLLELQDTQDGCIEWGRPDEWRYACCWEGSPYSICALSITDMKPDKPAITNKRPDVCFYDVPYTQCYWAVTNGGKSADHYEAQLPNTCKDFYDEGASYWWVMCCNALDPGSDYDPGARYLACTVKVSALSPRGPEPTLTTVPPDPWFLSTQTATTVYTGGIYCFAEHEFPLLPHSSE